MESAYFLMRSKLAGSRVGVPLQTGIQSIERWYKIKASVSCLKFCANWTLWAKTRGSSAQNSSLILGTQYCPSCSDKTPGKERKCGIETMV